MLGVALAVGLAFLPGSAHALDRVQGVVERVDTTAYVFTIRLDGAAKRQMSFKVTAERFDELELDVNDRLTVEYDRAECGSAAGCIPTAAKVDRRG